MSITVVVGAQWGDEGKGKWVDTLAQEATHIVRYQGGNNAGHTLYIKGQKIVLHQVPSGVFHDNIICALSAGVVVNPTQLVKELTAIRAYQTVTPERLWVSARAHLITPWCIYRDSQTESSSREPIGTTKRGIGPTYADKAARSGLRMGIYIDPERRQNWLQDQAQNNEAFANHRTQYQEEWDEFEKAAEELSHYVVDVEPNLRKVLKQGGSILLEGAQGALLDLDHGTYPFVTSSSTCAGGACASIGFSGRNVSRIIGIAKAYLTRVGSGPFPTELGDDAGKHLASKGNEFGATTGRPRRCGWFDAVAMRYAADVNEFDGIILNKLDVLSGLDEIKVCVGYLHPKEGRIDTMPWDGAVLEKCEPIYESYKGWQQDISGVTQFSQLPLQAQEYVRAIENSIGTKVLFVGTGVGAEDYLVPDHS